MMNFGDLGTRGVLNEKVFLTLGCLPKGFPVEFSAVLISIWSAIFMSCSKSKKFILIKHVEHDVTNENVRYKFDKSDRTLAILHMLSSHYVC